ncbi:CobW family GTP-binding protein [Marinobacter confluentis]|uniref:GTP-binding protein n=1 Tax=Marinobacter confluentis TaxID=1697557 RepID=A0A4Z1BKT0_9GAMM|nr:GTP-binding protein [Marinobacter confluentis]TGN40347.1 GTP-binding protein [Marinobacter confluentis]
MKHPIPTNLIFGFLGSGKTTAIQSLLAKKPAGETWAVLVNEFGEAGIDGHLLEGQGAVVREVPGGCMCCVAGLPMQMGLNMLIKQAQPDRLLIEPTGLGHPKQILETLQSEFYRDVLEIRACFTLIDPKRLQEPKVLANENFQAQVAVADVLIGNKSDCCEESERSFFRIWGLDHQESDESAYLTSMGDFPVEWLDRPRGLNPPPGAKGHKHKGDAPVKQWQSLQDCGWQQASNQGEGFYSCGWRIEPAITMDYTSLDTLANDGQWQRLKGFLNTSKGWMSFNALNGIVTTQPIPEQEESRLEIISDQRLDPVALDGLLRDCVSNPR